MQEIYKYVIDNILANKIDKVAGAQLINMIKQNGLSRKESCDMAIVGIDIKMPKANDLDEFWRVLENGTDCVGSFPESRLQEMHYEEGLYKELAFNKGAYLEHVSDFEPEFFKISPVEARIISPEQRMFLLTAWKSFEDANMSKKYLGDQKVGVYMGYSSDFGIEYKKFIENSDSNMRELAATGNIKSIIASRIAYYLDLHGPSMLIDTACSSGLTALHLAIQGIQNRDCELALVGGAKLSLFPALDKDFNIGIEASDGKTHTFDEDSDGTGFGEGIVAFVVMPLAKAIREKRHIYSIIKNTVVNQDGQSIGITAPNAMAQKDLLINCWKGADINPETISYIEAHGTGTSLGDPIEVSGMEMAFEQFTNKKQFCAVGSVKSNIGHLDCVAGLAGLIKAILALQNKKIPATINFRRPNRKIQFEKSPLYVNDVTSYWEANENEPRRAGVSAFGLSGTNTHVLLEEIKESKNQDNTMDSSTYIFTLSAKCEESLVAILKKYEEKEKKIKEYSIKDVCYTAAVGRNHYNHRLSIVVKDIEELFDLIHKLNTGEIKFENNHELKICYGYFEILDSTVPENKNIITMDMQRKFTMKANDMLDSFDLNKKTITEELVSHICELYVQGADVVFERLFSECNFVSLPTYVFHTKPYWVKVKKTKEVQKENSMLEGLSLLQYKEEDTFKRVVYSSEFDVDSFWVLSEHRVFGKCTLPGTAYIEMVRQAVSDLYGDVVIQYRDVVFMTPFIAEDNEIRKVRMIVEREELSHKFEVWGRNESEEMWECHVQGSFNVSSKQEVDFQIQEKVEKFKQVEVLGTEEEQEENAVVTGGRWKNIKWVKTIGNEVLARIELNEVYKEDIKDYGIHPALMDCAANVIIRNVGEGVYLPFFYKEFTFYHSFPDKFYSYIIKKEQDSKNSIYFDIIFYENEKKVLGISSNYSIMKVHNFNNKIEDKLYYSMQWCHRKRDVLNKIRIISTVVLMCLNRDARCEKLADLLREKDAEVHTCYYEDYTEADYKKWFSSLSQKDITHVVLYSGNDSKKPETGKKSMIALLYLMKMLKEYNLAQDISLTLIGQRAHIVVESDHEVNSYESAFLSMGKCIYKEYSLLICKSIDIDDKVSAEELLKEILYDKNSFAALRDDKRYEEELCDCQLEEKAEVDSRLKDNGTYVITGGLGSIGLRVAEMLSQYADVDISLISRRKLPSRENWGKMVKENYHSIELETIGKILKLEEQGAQISIYSVDVGDREGILQVFSDIKLRTGKIDGVFHCAGLAGSGFIYNKSIAQMESIMRPKVDGTNHIYKAIKGENAFLVLFSSITSVFGAPGQTDYIAANAYLDNFKFSKAVLEDKCKTDIITLNWTSWKEEGMAFDNGAVSDKEIKSITTQKAIQALEEILLKNVDRVVVGELDPVCCMENSNTLLFHFSDEIKNNFRKYNKKQAVVKEEQQEQVAIKGRDDGIYSKSEILLAQAWAQVLENYEINIYDNFYNLGGNSLVAVKLEIAMEKLNKNIKYSDIERFPTVYQLAAYMDGSDVGDELEIQKENIEETNTIKISSNAKVIGEMNPFKDLFYKSCFYHALFPVLQFYKRDLYGIFAEDIIYYGRIHKDNLLYFGLKYKSIIDWKDILQEKGIQVTEKMKTDNVVKEIEDSIDGKNPIIVTVDTFYESIRKDTYQKIHGPHSILIFGYDNQKREFYVIEQADSKETSYTSRKITYNDLEIAYTQYLNTYSHLDLKNSNQNRLIYDLDKEYPTIFSFKLCESDNENYIFGEECKKYYQKRFAEGVIRNKELIKIGLQDLNNFFSELKEKLDDDGFLIGNGEIMIGIFNDILVSRSMEKYRIEKIYEPSNLIDILNQLDEWWKKIRNVTAQFVYAGKIRKNKRNEYVNYFTTVIELEQNYYESLIHLSEKINHI